MKLKYYLRGLGIGIFVCSFILTLAIDKQPAISDDAVMKRAKELGMIENTKLSEQSDLKEETTEIEPVETEPVETEPVETKPIENPEAAVVDNESLVIEEETVTEWIQFEVIRGDSSYSVSKRLQEAGVVSSAKELDAYLCENGYDKKIRVGKHELLKTATFEDIAKAITN